MNDSRAKFDFNLFQMETFNLPINMAKGEPAVPVTLTDATIDMTIRHKNTGAVLGTFSSAAGATPPAYVDGAPMKGTIIISADTDGLFTLLMSAENTAHATLDGKNINAVYDIVYTPTGANAVTEIIMYGDVTIIGSPSRPVPTV